MDQLDENPDVRGSLLYRGDLDSTWARRSTRSTPKSSGRLNEEYPGKVFVLPTCDAMVLAAQYYHRGELPGVEGIQPVVGKKERSLWRDRLGHLGPGFGQLEGYVFYATIYGRSPELIDGEIRFERIVGLSESRARPCLSQDCLAGGGEQSAVRRDGRRRQRC